MTKINKLCKINKHCINCGKTTADHVALSGMASGEYRCKIEGAKMYFNLDHWSGENMKQLAERYGLKPCKCSKYQCWDCAYEDRMACTDPTLQHDLQRPDPAKINEYQCTICKKEFYIKLRSN